MPQPSAILSQAVAADATRPALTFYDDSPGGPGERIEISRKVLRTWVSKAANALQEGLDVQPGSVVLVDLPAPHWRLAYWALAVWSVGATLTVDTHEGADVLVTDDPDSEVAGDCDEVVAVALPALARAFDGELRSGVMDEAAELASYADDFTAWDEAEEEDTALVSGGERVTYADLLADLPPAPEAPGPCSAPPTGDCSCARCCSCWRARGPLSSCSARRPSGTTRAGRLRASTTGPAGSLGAMDKVVASAQDALEGLIDGMTLAVGGFGLSGIPTVLIHQALQQARATWRSSPTTAASTGPGWGCSSRRAGFVASSPPTSGRTRSSPGSTSPASSRSS
nr:TIGR03089 family protein [Serinicoccus sp. CNJ-927]